MIKTLSQIFKKHQETLCNFFWRSLQLAGKQGIVFIIFTICAKLLSPYEFGVYNYVLAILFFLIMFGDFGISTATSKYVAQYSATEKEKLSSVLFNSGMIIFVLTILVTFITLLAGPSYLKDKYIYVLYLLPLIFLSPMTSLYDGIYRGLKRFKQLAIISITIGLFSAGFVYLLIKNYGLIGALLSQNLFYLILLVGLALGYTDYNFRFNRTVIIEIGRYSFMVGISFVGYYLFSRVAVIILGKYNYLNEIAVYELLNRIFMLLLVPFTILGTVIAPNFTEYYATRRYELIISKFLKYFFIFLGISTIFALLSYFILPIVIATFFREYSNNIFSNMLIPVTLIYASQVYCVTINAGIIVATGHASLFTYPNLLAGALNIILSLILLNSFGYMGVIYSTLISNILIIIILHRIYYLRLKKLSVRLELLNA